MPADERGAETPSGTHEVTSPASAQAQTARISRAISVCPCPAVTPRDHRELPRRDQTDRGRRLQERHQANQEIGVGAERLADLAIGARGSGSRSRRWHRPRARLRPRAPAPGSCWTGVATATRLRRRLTQRWPLRSGSVRTPRARPPTSVGCPGSLADPRAGRNGVEHASTAPMISLSGTGPWIRAASSTTAHKGVNRGRDLGT